MTYKVTHKIALEEHFAIEETVQDSAGFVPASYWPELKHRLLDIQQRRIEEMDRNGVELMILSLNAPTVQAVANAQSAYELSRRANDFLADQIARRPDRFKGFAALPMQSPDLAARELERCVKMGFRGVLFNPDPYENTGTEAPPLGDRYWYPLYEKLCELDVPAHIHSAGSRSQKTPYTLNFLLDETVAVYGLIHSDVFKDFPTLKIVCSHGGGAIPYHVGRFHA